jgi:hypothetical protein
LITGSTKQPELTHNEDLNQAIPASRTQMTVQASLKTPTRTMMGRKIDANEVFDVVQASHKLGSIWRRRVPVVLLLEPFHHYGKDE